MSPAVHLGIQHIQNIFCENAHRMYHWADACRVPAENNLAERDLRPTVIARKVSFGSVSDAGAHTRSVLITVVHSLKKQKIDVVEHLKYLLDQLSQNMTLIPFNFSSLLELLIPPLQGLCISSLVPKGIVRLSLPPVTEGLLKKLCL